MCVSLNTSLYAVAAAKSRQSCWTLWNPIDGSPPGSPVPGILQTRTLEWAAISFSSAWKWKVKVKSLSRVRLFATHGLQPTRLLRPWGSPGKGAGVGATAFSASLYIWCNLWYFYKTKIFTFIVTFSCNNLYTRFAHLNIIYCLCFLKLLSCLYVCIRIILS